MFIFQFLWGWNGGFDDTILISLRTSFQFLWGWNKNKLMKGRKMKF